MKFLPFLLLAFILLFAACEKGDEVTNNSYYTTTVTPPATDLIPLKASNTWTWRYINYNMGTSDTTTWPEWIANYVVIDGELWSQQTDGVVTMDEINRHTGFYQYYGGEAHLLYKYPASVNDRVIADGTDTTDVTSVNAAVTVPAGSFTCHVYYFHHGGSSELYTYIAPGAGIIKKEMFIDGGLYLKQELISYSLH